MKQSLDSLYKSYECWYCNWESRFILNLHVFKSKKVTTIVSNFLDYEEYQYLNAYW